MVDTWKILERVLGPGGVIPDRVVNGALSYLTTTGYGSKSEISDVINKGAAQEVVELAIERGWRPK